MNIVFGVTEKLYKSERDIIDAILFNNNINATMILLIKYFSKHIN